MKIIVLLKQTPDTEAKVKISADGASMDWAGTKFVINPYDEYALEAAVQLKEKNEGSEVVVICVGPTSARELIVKGLAVGADRGLLIETAAVGFSADSSVVVDALKTAVSAENADIVLCGRHAIDDDNMHVGPMLAESLSWPHLNVVGSLEVSGDSATVERSVEGGQVEVYDVKLPFICGADKSLNTPRYAKLPDIMKAKKKPLDVKPLADFTSSTGVGVTLEGFEYPPEKPAGQMFQGEDVSVMVGKVVESLRNEAKVL